MASLPTFLLGAGITIAGLLVLAREKGRKEQLEKQQAEQAETESHLILGRDTEGP